MAIDEVHEGDIGTLFEFEINDGAVVDVSTSTSKTIKFKKPGGSVILRQASFVTNGTDGLLKYTTVVGDIDMTGRWYVQAVITLPGGTWSTDIEDFMVYENLS